MPREVHTAAAYHRYVMNLDTGKLEQHFFNEDQCFLWYREVGPLDMKYDHGVVRVFGPLLGGTLTFEET
jgi:hypothetical protein